MFAGIGIKLRLLMLALMFAPVLWAQKVDLQSNVKGTLPLANGGTNQTTWTASKCVHVKADGTGLEPASVDCGVGGTGTVTSSGSPVSGNVPKFTSATNIAPAAASNIIGLFSFCSGTQYLGADGQCHTPGTVQITGTPSSGELTKWSGPLSITNGVTAATIIALFTGCTGTNYLGADSTCHAAVGSGTVTTTGSPINGDVTKFSGATSVTTAAASDIVGLFSSCSGTQYLGADGQCHTPGAVQITGTPSSGELTRFSGPLSITNGVTAAAIVALFSSCSGTQYLGADGQCHTAGSPGSGALGGVSLKATDYLLATGDNGLLVVQTDLVDPHTFTLPATPPSTDWHVTISSITYLPSTYILTVARNGLLIDNQAQDLYVPGGSSVYITTDGANYFSARSTGPNYAQGETGDYTFSIADRGGLFFHSSVSPHTFTLLNAGAVVNSLAPWYVFITNVPGSAALTIHHGATGTLDGGTADIVLNAGEGVYVQSDDAGNSYTMRGIGGSGGSGTVTNIATASPISGGPITTTGTLSCPTCVTSAASLTNHGVVVGGGLQASVATVSGAADTIFMGNDSGVGYDPAFKAGPLGGTDGCAGVTDTPTYNTTTHAWGCHQISGSGGTGTVTNVATSSPLSGGPISATGTVSCPTCAVGPGSSMADHIAKFSGTDGLTLADGGPIPSVTVTPSTLGELAMYTGYVYPSLTVSGNPNITTSGAGGDLVLGRPGGYAGSVSLYGSGAGSAALPIYTDTYGQILYLGNKVSAYSSGVLSASELLVGRWGSPGAVWFIGPDPGSGLMIVNVNDGGTTLNLGSNATVTDTGVLTVTSCVGCGSGGGTVVPGTTNQIPYYAATGNEVSPNPVARLDSGGNLTVTSCAGCGVSGSDVTSRGPFPLENCTRDTTGIVTYKSESLAHYIRTGWEWAYSSSSNAFIYCSVTFPPVLPTGTAKIVLQNLASTGGAGGHTFMTSDGLIATSVDPTLTDQTPQAAYVGAAWQPTTLTFGVNSTPTPGATMVVKITGFYGGIAMQLGNAYLEFQ